jgi:NADH:ubiquinone oxidoreductase subunit K
MTDAGDRLEKVNLSDESGLRQSQVLIGYLVRLRERMTAHRDYYRASIDRFAKLKARLLLWHKYGRVVRQVLIWMLVSIFLLFESIVLVLRFGSELSGISSNFLDALAFFLLSMSMTLACVAVFAARVFRNRAYTSNVDVAVTECLKESAWARDSDGGDENTRLDRIIRNTLVGSNNLAVNRALLAAGVPSRNVSSG